MMVIGWIIYLLLNEDWINIIVKISENMKSLIDYFEFKKKSKLIIKVY